MQCIHSNNSVVTEQFQRELCSFRTLDRIFTRKTSTWTYSPLLRRVLNVAPAIVGACIGLCFACQLYGKSLNRSTARRTGLLLWSIAASAPVAIGLLQLLDTMQTVEELTCKLSVLDTCQRLTDADDESSCSDASTSSAIFDVANSVLSWKYMILTLYVSVTLVTLFGVVYYVQKWFLSTALLYLASVAVALLSEYPSRASTLHNSFVSDCFTGPIALATARCVGECAETPCTLMRDETNCKDCTDTAMCNPLMFSQTHTLCVPCRALFAEVVASVCSMPFASISVWLSILGIWCILYANLHVRAKTAPARKCPPTSTQAMDPLYEATRGNC